jgi:hypothetical protein
VPRSPPRSAADPPATSQQLVLPALRGA